MQGREDREGRGAVARLQGTRRVDAREDTQEAGRGGIWERHMMVSVHGLTKYFVQQGQSWAEVAGAVRREQPRGSTPARRAAPP